MKVSEIPWPVAIIVSIGLILFVVVLGVMGYEVNGFSNSKPIGIVRRSEAEQVERSLYEHMNMLCGVINNKWDYGRAFELTTNVSCTTFCATQDEDTKGCAGFISYNESETESRYARQECNNAVGPEYFKEGIHNYCCCN